ncbi:helix-turn-helix domain-containing protein [Paenibacillus sp. Soil522]|uniref:helix-turn-helix domain-containing protein n=1 Tax=Paenibacillus sp. Soil522 TaxID=1736388 RepID=UPI0006FB2861|nr:helix-turn-helix domain-containing protein [Paenibacillus sp. Soil522]KRE47823.1 AraC family transcriptional regulator [Paenibacillus sp. Soil522]
MKVTDQKRSMGILQLSEGEKKFQLTRYAPSGPLQHFVKHYWIVSWNLEGQAPYLQDVVPNPCVNMVMEDHRSGIYGVASRMYTKKIEGKGQVFGVKFQPGGFYPFIKSPLSMLKDQALSIESVFGINAIDYEQQLKSETDPAGMIALTESLFLQRLPGQDGAIKVINQMIARILEDPDLTRVEQLCGLFDINKRKLQRLFNQYVGISPKWVIKLYRLQNAAEAMDSGSHHDLLKLSADLGYYDQSHFIKDFKSIIGKTPEEYAKSISL